MGLNSETNGYYSTNDVLYSNQFQTRIERDEANKQVIIEKLENYNLATFSDHLIKKTLLNFNDGSFAWTKEGTFFKTTFEDKNILSPIFKSFYYENGTNFKLFLFFLQSIWILLLILMALSGISSKKNNIYYLLIMTFIGCFLFSIIFEARARYLFVNASLFIILAGYGLEQFFNLKLYQAFTNLIKSKKALK